MRENDVMLQNDCKEEGSKQNVFKFCLSSINSEKNNLN